MRKTSMALLLPMAVAACAPMSRTEPTSSMQGTTEPVLVMHTQTAGAPLLPAGTMIRIELDQTLGPATIHSPSTFSATVIEPVFSDAGSTLVPAGATIHGATVDSEGTLAPPQVLIGLRPESLEIDGVSFPIESEVVQVDPADVTSGLPMRGPGYARFGTLEAMTHGAIITNGPEMLKENELGLNPGTVISVGPTLDSALQKGTQMTLHVVEPSPLSASVR